MVMFKIKYFQALIIISFILFFNFPVLAAKIIVNDSSIIPKENQQSKKYFLDKYGKDDSSRALIEFFFKRQHTGKLEAFIWAGIGSASSIFFDRVIVNGTGPPLGALGVLIGIFTACLIWTSIGGVLAGIFILLKYNRKRLLKLLVNYDEGKGIPKSFLYKRRFNKQLELEKRSLKN